MNRRFAVAILSLALGAPMAYSAPTPPKPNPMAAQVKGVNDARTALEQAKAQLRVIRKRIAPTFEAKPEFKAAKDSMDKAKSEYEVLGHKIVTTLEKSAEYKAQITKRDKAQAILDKANKPADLASGEERLSSTDIANASRDRAEAGLALKKMEKESQEADPKYLSLKQKYTDARTAYEAMEAQIDEAVKQDPAYPDVQKAIDAAEVRLKQAEDALAAAQKQAHARPPSSAPPRR